MSPVIDAGANPRRQIAAVVARVADKAYANLLKIARAYRTAAFFARRGKRRQEHSGQDRDDGDHDQKLNQRKR